MILKVSKILLNKLIKQKVTSACRVSNRSEITNLKPVSNTRWRVKVKNGRKSSNGQFLSISINCFFSVSWRYERPRCDAVIRLFSEKLLRINHRRTASRPRACACAWSNSNFEKMPCYTHDICAAFLLKLFVIINNDNMIISYNYSLLKASACSGQLPRKIYI